MATSSLKHIILKKSFLSDIDKLIRNFQDCPRILGAGYSPAGVVKLLTFNSYTVYVNSSIFFGISDADKKDDGLTVLVEFDVLCKKDVLPFSRRMQKRAQAGTGLFYGGFTHVSGSSALGVYQHIS